MMKIQLLFLVSYSDRFCINCISFCIQIACSVLEASLVPSDVDPVSGCDSWGRPNDLSLEL